MLTTHKGGFSSRRVARPNCQGIRPEMDGVMNVCKFASISKSAHKPPLKGFIENYKGRQDQIRQVPDLEREE